MGLGQLGFYAWAVLTTSFYVRKQIGQKTLRILHYLSFLTYLGALVHAWQAGRTAVYPGCRVSTG